MRVCFIVLLCSGLVAVQHHDRQVAQWRSLGGRGTTPPPRRRTSIGSKPHLHQVTDTDRVPHLAAPVGKCAANLVPMQGRRLFHFEQVAK